MLRNRMFDAGEKENYHTILQTQNLVKSLAVCARNIDICHSCYHREYEYTESHYISANPWPYFIASNGWAVRFVCHKGVSCQLENYIGGNVFCRLP